MSFCIINNFFNLYNIKIISYSIFKQEFYLTYIVLKKCVDKKE